MNIEAIGEKESPDEDKGTEERVLGDQQSPFSVSELKVNATNEVEQAGAGSGVQGPSSLQVQQQPQPPQGTVVCWERFLPVRSIRVLLVENDDCTRHVVSALLRNCNYEVLAAANGLQAWKILEDLANHIDLVLTEVVMPCFPGIPLLNKIMSHKTRKNIPVIMMSSHDSMSLVFKCLSKGAVDFLVKPIRKNELKNLWQHVWRRCHSSSGSGSESGTQTQKSVKSKSSEKSDNSISDDGENDLSNGLNGGDGSDDGSGAQSSWTKQPVEVDSSRAMSPMDQVAECQDSTCAQVIRSNAENLGYKGASISVARGGHKQKQHDDKNLEKLKLRNVESRAENQVEVPLAQTSSKLESFSELNYKTIINQIDIGQPNPTSECPFSDHKVESDEIPNPLIDGRESESTKDVANILDCNNNATDDSKEPNVELSLKRLRGVEDTGRSVQDDRYVLRRSEQSAFSRYNTASNVFKAPNGVTGSSSVIDNSVEVVKREFAADVQAHSGDHLVNLSPNGVSNNLDMGSTTNKLSTNPLFKKDKSEATSTVNGSHPSAFRPVQNDLRCSRQHASLPLQGDMPTTNLGPAGDSHQEPPMQNSHRHSYHHHHRHHFHNSEQQPSSTHDELSSKKLAADAPHCGSTNAFGGMDSNPRNYSLNRSASGSNYGSNGQNGSSTAINAAGTNAESDVGPAGKSGSGDASGSGSGNRVDEDKLAHRVAALSKFRQKKKDRCFAKKVRYHNRKKLAEKRPRVRGQFVKQTGTDSSNKTTDE